MSECILTSLVVPVHNGAKTLKECLAAIARLRPCPDQVIVVDDGSTDESASLARDFGAEVYVHQNCRGSREARLTGMAHARGELLIFVDADIVVQPDAIAVIQKTLSLSPYVDAVTGLLHPHSPLPGFFSAYKHLYMHYMFKRLPHSVTFVYGGIFALRKAAVPDAWPAMGKADDTALGQLLVEQGREIRLCADLQVKHLKEFTIRSLFYNDFTVARSWARIFWCFAGWRQLGKHKTGFAHASKAQLAGLAAACLTVFLSFLGALQLASFVYPALSAVVWLAMGAHFFFFLFLKRGLLFALVSIPVTFLDHLVMSSGVLVGSLQAFARWICLRE